MESWNQLTLTLYNMDIIRMLVSFYAWFALHIQWARAVWPVRFFWQWVWRTSLWQPMKGKVEGQIKRHPNHAQPTNPMQSPTTLCFLFSRRHNIVTLAEWSWDIRVFKTGDKNSMKSTNPRECIASNTDVSTEISLWYLYSSNIMITCLYDHLPWLRIPAFHFSFSLKDAYFSQFLDYYNSSILDHDRHVLSIANHDTMQRISRQLTRIRVGNSTSNFGKTAKICQKCRFRGLISRWLQWLWTINHV